MSKKDYYKREYPYYTNIDLLKAFGAVIFLIGAIGLGILIIKQFIEVAS